MKAVDEGGTPRVGEPFRPFMRFTDGCSIIPEAMSQHTGLSALAKLAWGRLARYQGKARDCYVSTAELAAEIGVKTRQARYAVAELEAGGFIRRCARAGRTNIIEFLWHPVFEAPPRQKSAGVPRQNSAPPPRQKSAAKESHLKESHLKESHLKEIQRKADYGPGIEKHDARSGDALRAHEAPHAKPQRERWSASDLGQVAGKLSAFMDGDAPPQKLVDWIRENYAPREVMQALEVAWNRRAAPGKKNAPEKWQWFYEVLRNALNQGYAPRLPEVPAAPHPEHSVEPEELARGIEAIELPDAPRSLVESARCGRCGGGLCRYTNGTIESTCTCGGGR